MNLQLVELALHFEHLLGQLEIVALQEVDFLLEVEVDSSLQVHDPLDFGLEFVDVVSDYVLGGRILVGDQALPHFVLDEDGVLCLHLHVAGQSLHGLLQFLYLSVGGYFPLQLLHQLRVFVDLLESALFLRLVQEVGENHLLRFVEVESRVVSRRERLHSQFLFVVLHLNLNSSGIQALS